MTRLLKKFVSDLDAVQQIDVVAAALSGHGGQTPRLLDGRAARAAGRDHHSVAELRELHELAAVEW